MRLALASGRATDNPHPFSLSLAGTVVLELVERRVAGHSLFANERSSLYKVVALNKENLSPY